MLALKLGNGCVHAALRAQHGGKPRCCMSLMAEAASARLPPAKPAGDGADMASAAGQPADVETLIVYRQVSPCGLSKNT